MATVTEMPTPAAFLGERPADFSAEEFFAMIEAGGFDEGRRIFLWGGRIFEKMAKTQSHAIASVQIGEVVRSRMPAGWLIWPENPIQLNDRHVPLPDIAVVRGPLELYKKARRIPTPLDVGLLVEVAVTSLPKDLGERAEKFARALISTYWVADVLGRKLIEHRRPAIDDGVGRYLHVRAHGLNDEVDLIFDDHVSRVAVADLLL